MFRSFFVFITILILISACTPALQATPIPVIDDATSTSSPPPTPTWTALPSATPTTSITPLPTIPTFTPTFDVSTIGTVTPAPKAECSIQNDKTIDAISFDEQKISNILKALNQGVPLNTVLKAVEKGAMLYYSENGIKGLPEVYVPPTERDLNNDGNSEIIIPNGEGAVLVYYVIGCRNQKYDVLFSTNDMGLYFMTTQIVNDANKNGLPEVLFSKGRCDFGGCGGEFEVLEWNGISMKVILDEQDLRTFYDSITVEDIDADGLKEFLWSGNTPVEGGWDWEDRGPWRIEKHSYKWNGSVFAPLPIEYTVPRFRFQALQDADRYILEGKYDKALSLYQDVIFSDKLDWWSPKRQSYQHEIALLVGANLATPTLIPPDNTEYPRLAAYAYYRIMLIHLVQNHESDATTVYNTLQEKFSNDSYGRPYVEMASTFWNAYQSTHTMYNGCAAAIQYAAEHPEILIPLGSDYHGWQSHQYKPEDVCPFR